MQLTGREGSPPYAHDNLFCKKGVKGGEQHGQAKCIRNNKICPSGHRAYSSGSRQFYVEPVKGVAGTTPALLLL